MCIRDSSLTYHQTSLVFGLEQYAQSQAEKNESPAESPQLPPTTAS